MPVELLQQAPADNATGILHVKYLLNDRLVNIQRIHLDTIDNTAVATAFTDYAAIVKLMYSSAWTIQLSALDAVQDITDALTGLPARQATSVPTPFAADVPGESVTTSTGITGLTQTIFVFDLPELDVANNAHKFRLRFVGVAGSLPAVSTVVAADAAGTPEEKLVALLTGAGPWLAHDGTKPLSPARVHTPLESRERRRMMRKK